MPSEYPYMISNNKIGIILEKMKSAARPPKFTNEFLKNIGLTSSNDRAVIPLLRKLGFITDDGTPTQYYDRLKDPTQLNYVLGERVKDLYADLFTINTSINTAPDDEVKGAFARITGKDEKSVLRYFLTFKALVQLSKFDGPPTAKKEQIETAQEPQKSSSETVSERSAPKRVSEFHYNIQIHLPATTDISVYNAIFKSLKEHLNI